MFKPIEFKLIGIPTGGYMRNLFVSLTVFMLIASGAQASCASTFNMGRSVFNQAKDKMTSVQDGVLALNEIRLNTIAGRLLFCSAVLSVIDDVAASQFQFRDAEALFREANGTCRSSGRHDVAKRANNDIVVTKSNIDVISDQLSALYSNHDQYCG